MEQILFRENRTVVSQEDIRAAGIHKFDRKRRTGTLCALTESLVIR